MKEAYLALAGRIRRELTDLSGVVGRTQAIWDHAGRSQDDYYVDATALNLHSFYAGVERLLELIANVIDRTKPGGASWHQELLHQMVAEIPGVRPALELTHKERAAYRVAARRRWQRRRHEQSRRRKQARMVAQQAAALLKGEFEARRVVLFGSLAREDIFHIHSDIDLAVWGLNEKKYYRAVSRLLDLDPAIEIDLVMAEEATPNLLAAIDKEGILL